MDEKRTSVDFESKEKARNAGAHVVNGTWMIKKSGSDEFHEDADKQSLLDLAERIMTPKQKTGEYKAPDSLRVPENCLCDESENKFWEELLDYRYWNALTAVLKIKQSGLPRTTEQRAKMLNYFASVNTYRAGEQYNVSYKELCDYSEKFEEAYNYQIVSAIKRHHGITGFNFEMSLNKNELTEEEKALLRFVFPIKVKTMVRERYLENEVPDKQNEAELQEEAEAFPC